MGDAERASTSARYLAAGGAGGDAWAAEARAEGRRGTQRIVQAGEVPAPELVAVRLGVEPGQAVIARRRIMYADDEPCELTDTYYPASIARGTALAGTAKIRGGAVRLLAELGHVGAWVEEDVTARLPTPDEATTLALSGSEPPAPARPAHRGRRGAPHPAGRDGDGAEAAAASVPVQGG